MSGPLLALRAALRQACLADAALATLMGGTVAVHDDPPRGAPPIYALFGDATLRDLSTSTERGHEQMLDVAVWALPGSTASAVRAADRICELLDEAPLALAGHRLVHLAVTAVETRRDPESELARVTITFRAVTEVAT